jgi:hypothetical protein
LSALSDTFILLTKRKKEEKMSYSYNTKSNSFSKWDTIQEDVADQYAYLNDEVEQEEDEDDDIFGFTKAIQIDHLTDEQLDMIGEMFN